MLLNVLSEGKTSQTELNKILGIGKAQFYTILKELTNEDYIKKQNSEIVFKKNAKAALFQDVASKYNTEKLLHDSNDVIFSILSKPVTMDDLRRLSNLSLRAIQRSISELESIGVIKKENGKLSIDDNKEQLYLFAKLLKTERQRKQVEPYAELIYQDQTRTIKKIPKGAMAQGELTGFSLFSDYGIEYHTTDDYYVTQQSALTIEEVLIHAVLSAKKASDKLGLTIAILFYLKNKPKMDPLSIRKVAKSHGIDDLWVDVEGYVRNNRLKNQDFFLPRAEFEQKAALYQIPPDMYALPEGYPKLFEDIGNALKSPAEAYLFGGENMRIKGLKDRTKDCDIVIKDDNSYNEVISALKSFGYTQIGPENFSYTDKRISPSAILIHDKRSTMDIFKSQICRKMYLSDRMILRSDKKQFGNLRLGILQNEDVFLLKGVTDREGEIQDMAKLAQSGSGGFTSTGFTYSGFVTHSDKIKGFDWDVVWSELDLQEHDTRNYDFASIFLDSVDLLIKQTGIRPPFYKKLERKVLDNEINKLLRDGERPLKQIIELLVGEALSEKTITNRIDYLTKMKFLKKESRKDGVYVVPKMKNALNVYPKMDVNIRKRILDHIDRLATKLGTSTEVRDKAKEIVSRGCDRGAFVSNKPSAVAAGAIQLAGMITGDHYQRDYLASVAKINPATLTKYYKSLQNWL
jgi:DNA-binding Lrp family transcriptional regulator